MKALSEPLARAFLNRRGSAAVGFSLTLPVLLMMIGGIIEMSRFMYTDSTLKYAVQEAARTAIVSGAASSRPISQDGIGRIVRSTSVSLDPDLIVVDVTYSPDNKPGSTVTVQASYRFDFVLPLLDGIGGIDLNQTASMVIAN